MWALDYHFDVIGTGRMWKILHVVDEFTRESLADIVAHSIDADVTVAVLDKIAAALATFPAFVRCGNGPEPTANALRGWCPFTVTGTSHREPGSPGTIQADERRTVRNKRYPSSLVISLPSTASAIPTSSKQSLKKRFAARRATPLLRWAKSSWQRHLLGGSSPCHSKGVSCAAKIA